MNRVGEDIVEALAVVINQWFRVSINGSWVERVATEMDPHFYAAAKAAKWFWENVE